MSESTAVAEVNGHGEIMQRVIQGDIGALSPTDRTRYVLALCQTLGLNPTTAPIQILTLGGKMVCYMRKDGTEQLRKIHNVSLTIVRADLVEGVYTVTVRAILPGGRTDEATGSVWLGDIKGEARANAVMKAETKAKRRATLSICGLGFLDESEVADMPDARSEPALRETRKQLSERHPLPVDAEAEGPNPALTDEQSEEIGMLLDDIGMSVTDLEKKLKKQLKLTDWHGLSVAQADSVIAWLKEKKAETEQQVA